MKRKKSNDNYEPKKCYKKKLIVNPPKKCYIYVCLYVKKIFQPIVNPSFPLVKTRFHTKKNLNRFGPANGQYM